MRRLSNIYWLGAKEIRSFLHDRVLLAFVIYAFSLAVVAMAQSVAQELHNATIAIADEDHSELSRAISLAFLPPYFRTATAVAPADTDLLLDRATDTFVLDIPPHFERDVKAGRSPAIQVNVDATAAMQAGIGAGYIEQILDTEIARVATRQDPTGFSNVALTTRISYNPNTSSAWFMGVMGIINNITMLAIILAGAAVLREREHGTIDHLLVMPLTPMEIALAKIWANGLIIAVAAALSLTLVVQGLLGIPIHGSVPLFLCGVVLYLFFATAIGILLSTIAHSMPQLGLLYMLVALPMNILSGSNTPLESMPPVLQAIMQVSPSTHFVSFAQAILYRGAGLSVVWPDFLATGAVGLVVFALALLRFRSAMAAEGQH
jgi:ABC-2 type transport system permease protein